MGVGWFSVGYGVDLGTANTVVCRPNGAVVLNEPSVMVVRTDDHRKALLIGSAARELVGRTPVGAWQRETGVSSASTTTTAVNFRYRFAA
jgi:actin-like ATPase involved in cell morphogenesis